MLGLGKLTTSKLTACAGISALLAVGAPAVALAHTVTTHTASHHTSTHPAVREPAGFRLDSCTGTVFGDITLQNVKSGNYLAKSTVDDSLVLYTHTDQRLDGYRDADGHLIIYICGTNDVFTDIPKAECTTGYLACAYVEPYNDNPDQWWTRVVNGNIWNVQCLAPNANGKVLDDPNGTDAEGTHVTLDMLGHNEQDQEFRVG